MKQLTSYLTHRIILMTLFTLLVLVSLFLFFNILNEMTDIGRGNYTFKEIVIVTLFRAPDNIYQLLPLSILIGTMIAMAQFAASSEYAVMRTAGVSLAQITWILLKIGALFAIITLLLGEFVAPASSQHAERIRLQALRSMVSQEFRSGLWVKNDGQIINVREMLPDTTLLGIRVYNYDQDFHLVSAQDAQRGVYQGQGNWLLSEVAETRLTPNATQVAHYPTLSWNSVLQPSMLAVLLVIPERMSALNLIRYIQHLRSNQQQTARYEIALWGKLFYPISCLSMVLVALAFTPVSPRQISLGVPIFIGIFVGLSFYFLNRLCGHLGLLYEWPAALVTVLPTVLFLAGGCLYLVKMERR